MRTASAWYTHIYLLRVVTSSTDFYTIGYMSLTEKLDTHHVQNKAIKDSRLPPGATWRVTVNSSPVACICISVFASLVII